MTKKKKGDEPNEFMKRLKKKEQAEHHAMIEFAKLGKQLFREEKAASDAVTDARSREEERRAKKDTPENDKGLT